MDDKVHVHFFSGGKNARAWCTHMNNSLRLLAQTNDRFNDPEYVHTFIVQRLIDDAALWLQSQRIASNSMFPWADTDAFFFALIAHYDPSLGTEEPRDQLDALRQRGPVANYIREFNSLALKVPNFNADGEGKHAFIRGLRPALSAEVKMRQPATLEQAMTIAVSADRSVYQRESAAAAAAAAAAAHQQLQHPRAGYSAVPAVAAAHDHAAPMELGAAAAAPSKQGCYICGHAGHAWKFCRRKSEFPCRKCGRVGHPAIFCRSNARGR